jgi:hypothetical protein
MTLVVSGGALITGRDNVAATISRDELRPTRSTDTWTGWLGDQADVRRITGGRLDRADSLCRPRGLRAASARVSADHLIVPLEEAQRILQIRMVVSAANPVDS